MLAMVAATPGAIFAPPLDRPLTVSVVQERIVAGAVHRFTAERRLVFRRDGPAIHAELTLLEIATDAPEPLARQFLSLSGGLKGRTLRFLLAADGRVTTLLDQDAAWEAAIRPIRDITLPAQAQDMVGRPAGPLEALSREQRAAMLAEPLSAVLAADAATAVGSTGVTVPAGPLGGGVTLTGTRTARREASGRLVITTDAGTIDGDDTDRQVHLRRVRVVDPQTGLLLSEEDTQRMTLDGAEQVTRSWVRIAPGI